MSTKAKGVSCYDEAGGNEELFVLRGTDVSSPLTIMQWIALNFEVARDDKLREAFECALRMKHEIGRKRVGTQWKGGKS